MPLCCPSFVVKISKLYVALVESLLQHYKLHSLLGQSFVFPSILTSLNQLFSSAVTSTVGLDCC